jgi:hypothetical protein
MTEGTVFTHDDDGFHVQPTREERPCPCFHFDAAEDDESCECGHVLDEHDRQLACTAVVR